MRFVPCAWAWQCPAQASLPHLAGSAAQHARDSMALPRKQSGWASGVYRMCRLRCVRAPRFISAALRRHADLKKFPGHPVAPRAAQSSSEDGHNTLIKATALMKKVADSINEIKRGRDISKYVNGLQQRLLGWDGPDLVSFGQLKDAGDFKVADSANKRSQRQVLLFEYGIFICKPRQGGMVTVKHYFQMSDLYLQTMLNDPVCFRLTLANDKKVFFTFHCTSQEDKQYWIAKIKKTMIDFYSAAKKDSTNDLFKAGKTPSSSSASTTCPDEDAASTSSSNSSNKSSVQKKIQIFQRKSSHKASGRRRYSLQTAFEKPPVRIAPHCTAFATKQRAGPHSLDACRMRVRRGCLLLAALKGHASWRHVSGYPRGETPLAWLHTAGC